MWQTRKAAMRFEFENRIFISFGIVILVVLLSFTVFKNIPSAVAIACSRLGFNPVCSLRLSYGMALLAITAASIIRMWAGSILTSGRMMSFKVRPERLITTGPYSFVRNPIYFADLVAMSGFSLILPLSGLLLPLLFLLHYWIIICYEEECLQDSVKNDYLQYFKTVPRLFPRAGRVSRDELSFRNFRVNYDGFRHNALYIFFIPGLIISAFTDNIIYTFLIGIPAVAEWGYIHTKIGMKPDEKRKAAEAEKSIPPIKKKIFKRVLYAQCWEDPALDREAFRITNEDTVFTITSGGCNALSFLLDDPQKVISLDMNEKQNFLLELKIAAFKCLSYEDMLEFFGIKESKRRYELYDKIRGCLTPGAAEYWNSSIKQIKKGIINAGRYEDYMKLLRKVLILIQGRKLINRFFNAGTKEERIRLYEKEWNNFLWKLFIRFFLSRRFMSMLFDKAFFRYIEDDFSFGVNFERKIRYALTCLPVKENYFLSYILLGRYFSMRHLPYYLRRENYKTIRERLERIEIITESCERYFARLDDNSISKFNFTNIFEWMPEKSFEGLLNETVRVARNNAVITYRNLLVHRERPSTLEKKIHPQRKLAQDLHRKDLSFIYDRYVVETVSKGVQNEIYN